MKRGRLGRYRVIRVVSMIALARDIDSAVLQLILIGDVVDQWIIRHGEARIVLGEDLAEVLHGGEELIHTLRGSGYVLRAPAHEVP